MRWVIVLFLLGAFGFGTGAFGRMSSASHVWPIGFTFHPLMTALSLGGVARTPGALEALVGASCGGTAA